MSTEERRVQLVAEVDTTRTRSGFQEIGQQAGQMAQQVTRAGEQAERAVAGVGSGAGTSSQRVDSASRSIVASIQRTTAAMEAGGRQTAAYYEVMARQRGIDPNTLRPYLDQLRAVEQAQTRAAASGVASAGQIANAMRMVPAQLTDVATQLAGGQSPFLVLLQQGGQLRDSFGSIPATIRGVGASILSMVSPVAIGAAAVGALAYAYSEGSKEADAYTRSIIMSANAAGVSTSQMSAYAAAISKTVGTQAEAAQAVSALVGTGQVSADNLKQFGNVAVQVQKYIGRSVEETVKDFQELGKSPVQASLKLSESYNYLTGAVYEQIKALQDQGKTEAAAEIAQKAYATAFADRAAKMKDNLGIIERAWMGAKDSAASAWDVFLGVGRKKTPAQELAEVQAQIALARQPAGTGGGDRGDAAEMRRAAAAAKLTELLKRESDLQKQVDKEAADAQAAAAKEKLRQAELSWKQIMDGTLSQAKRQQQEIEAVTQKGTEAGASQEDINKAIAKVKEKYFALNNVTLTQLENNRNLQKEKMAGELADAESQYKRQLISQDEYYAKKRDIQLREIDLEIPILKEQVRIADGKEEKSAREKANGELAVLMQKRANIISGAANAVKDADFDRSKTVDALVNGWDRTIAAQKEAIAQQIILFGQSDQAQRVYLEQAKIQLEVEKQIADLAKAGHALTEQEIADFYRKANARKAQKGELLNQEAALAAANQLLRDNEKFSAQYIADTDLRAQRITAIDAKQWQYLIDHTAEGSEARKKILEQFDVWMANRQMQPVLDRWKGVIDNLDNNFQEGFRDMLTSGQNAWSSFAKSIGNTLKTSLADALYQTFIKKYVVQIVASLAGAISGPAVASTLAGAPVAGVSGGVGAAGSAISAAQTASSIYSAITGGFSSLTTGVADAVQAGLYSTGLSSNIASNGSVATGAGWAAGTVGGYMIGSTLNSAISGKYETGSGFMTAEKIGTAVASAIFGPIGGAVAGAIGGMVNRAFGMGPKEIRDQGISGTLSASSLTGENYTNWHQDGGWFRSDKNGTDTKALTDAMVKQFTQGLATIENASAGFASSLGVQADWIKDYSKVFDLKLTGDATKDQQVITDFFSGIGDEIARKLVPNLDDLSKSGETASAALERLANDFKGTDQIAQLLGFSASQLFGTAGLDSAKAREQLIDMAGGLQVLSGYASTFNKEFLTDGERIAPVAAALDKALASLGLNTIPTTRDEFKSLVNDLVNSGAAVTESGAKQLDSLLALAEAFAMVHPAADAAAKAVSGIADEHKNLLNQLDELTMTSIQLLAKQRAAIDETNLLLFDQVRAAKAVQDARQALNAAYQQEQQNIVTLRDRMRSLSSTWSKLLSDLKLGDSSPLTPEQKYLEAKSQYEKTLAAAKAGDQGAQDNYEKVAKAFLDASRIANASSAAYTSDFNLVQAGLTDAASWAAQQVDVAQASLDALNAQVAGLIDINKSVLSVHDAIAALGAAMLNASSIGAPLPSTTTIEGLYETVLGRKADDAGLAYWKWAQTQGVSISDIATMMTQSVEYQTSKIEDLYEKLFNRSADSAGLSYWLDAMKQGVTLSDMESMMKQSNEYQSSHPSVVYTPAFTPPVAAPAAASNNGPTAAQVQTLIDQIAGLRSDQRGQSDAQVNATIEAASMTATAVSQGVAKGAETVAYKSRNMEAIE